MRNTQSKRIVSELLQHSSRPMSLADVFARAKVHIPSLAFSTVMRIVKQLEAAGEVVRIDWRERGSHFEWATDPHHHIVCRICGTIRDLDDNDLGFDSAAIERLTGFSVKRHSIELDGLCATCQQA